VDAGIEVAVPFAAEAAACVTAPSNIDINEALDCALDFYQSEMCVVALF
jgi:hypothetical protein